MTTLRHGDRSQAVLILQKNLIKHGAKLTPDGDYGDATEAAVRAYQVKVGLVADGIAGTKTQASLPHGPRRAPVPRPRRGVLRVAAARAGRLPRTQAPRVHPPGGRRGARPRRALRVLA